MKILQVNSVCGVGSTGRIATDIYGYLREQGHEGAIAFGRGDARGCDRTYRIGGRWGNYAHVAKARVLDRTGFASGGATRRLIRWTREQEFDLVQLHNVHGYYLHIGEWFRYLREAGKPVIWTLHDCWAFTGHCAYFDYAGCARWRTGCHDCPQKHPYPARWLIDASARNYRDKRALFAELPRTTLVTPSAWLAELARDSFLGAHDVRVIPNGIDLGVFRPDAGDFRAAHGIGADDFVMLGVAGYWEERKGLRYLCELAETLGPAARLVVVGVSEREKALLPTGAIGITRTDSAAALAQIYSAADVFVNPTLEDNFPTTNLEALACGTPVVTFRTGGSPESVTPDTGLVADQGDGAALAAAVREVRERGKASYTAACVASAAARYDKRLAYTAYTKLYEEVTAGDA